MFALREMDGLISIEMDPDNKLTVVNVRGRSKSEEEILIG